MPQSYRLSMAGGPAGGRPRLCSGGLGLVAGVAYGASQGLPCNHAMQRLRRLPLLGLLGLVWLLAAFPGAAGRLSRSCRPGRSCLWAGQVPCIPSRRA